MGFISILNPEGKPETQMTMPSFFEDLNLDRIVKQIQSMTTCPVEKYFYQLPDTAEGEAYRRGVYGDVKKTAVYETLSKFMDMQEGWLEAKEAKSKVERAEQAWVWHVQEVSRYCKLFETIYEGLSFQEMISDGMKAFVAYLAHFVKAEDFLEMKQMAEELFAHMEGFQICLEVTGDQVYVSRRQVEGNYQNFLRTHFGEVDVTMKSPFVGREDLTSLESEILDQVARAEKPFFRQAKEFYEKYKDYEDQTLTLFGQEISYYLSYHMFQKYMEKKGFAFVTPTVDMAKDMGAFGLYDLALALANSGMGKEVVSNDFVYTSGENFLVVTGPNQGGKTTFARSLGQLVYLSKMGFDVPATAANVHEFSTILTHFSVEESVETGRGKLMDELVRLKPMMEEHVTNAFVVINELFTTAANYDACIMGRKVLEHFIGSDCRGIYVTHLKELTTVHQSVVSMRAMTDEDRVQNYKICRSEADDSVCAQNQVNKYKLTYEQLKTRLGLREGDDRVVMEEQQVGGQK